MIFFHKFFLSSFFIKQKKIRFDKHENCSSLDLPSRHLCSKITTQKCPCLSSLIFGQIQMLMAISVTNSDMGPFNVFDANMIFFWYKKDKKPNRIATDYRSNNRENLLFFCDFFFVSSVKCLILYWNFFCAFCWNISKWL